MLVADVMTARPVMVRPETTAEEALRLLSEESVTALPVVADGGRLLGIVSEADLLRRAVAGATSRDAQMLHPSGSLVARPLVEQPTVADVMTRGVLTATPGQDVAKVVDTMLGRDVHSVPVVVGSRVVGVMSCSDVVRALARDDGHIAAEVTALFADAQLPRWRCVVERGHVHLAGGSAVDRPLAESLARSVQGVRSVAVETDGRRQARHQPQVHAVWPI